MCCRLNSIINAPRSKRFQETFGPNPLATILIPPVVPFIQVLSRCPRFTNGRKSGRRWYPESYYTAQQPHAAEDIGLDLLEQGTAHQE